MLCDKPNIRSNQLLVHIQMVKIELLTRHQRSDAKTLNLSNSHSDKIHNIEALDRFKHLTSLNLSNNMIAKIQNLQALRNLTVLNLDFNQIATIENIRHLNRLEELSINYNCIRQISSEIKFNQRLKVIHIAYNDIKSLEDIGSLSQLPTLAVLSLAGNPFLSALSYISFIKMLIPTLLVLDSKDVNQVVINSSVQPQEQIFILRDALNKLIDERNSMMIQQTQALQSQSPIKEREREEQEHTSPREQLLQHKHSFGKPPSLMVQNERKQLLDLLEQWIQGSSSKLEVKRLEISELSENYSRQLAANTHSDNSMEYQDLYEKIRKYKNRDEKGVLSSQKKEKLIEMQITAEKYQKEEQKKRQESRIILAALKNKEQQYLKLKNKANLLKNIKRNLEENSTEDPHKLFLSQILEGRSTFHLNYKNIKRHLFYPKGLIEMIELLSRIVFGQAADYDRVLRLKNFLGEKSLIEIINNLKQIGMKHQKEKKRYERQKSKLIAQLEREAQQLCQEWQQLQHEKRLLQNSRELQEMHSRSPPLEQKSLEISENERNRILALKKEKEHYEKRIEELKKTYNQLQAQFQRKYQQLEEFELFFEEFKKDKEIATDLKQEKQSMQAEIDRKKSILFEIDHNIKELQQKEELLQDKASIYQRKAFEKSEQLRLYEEKLKAVNEKVRRGNEDFNLKNYEFANLQEDYTKIMQQYRQFQKKMERMKNSVDLYEQKLKNLSEIETNKKNNLGSIQLQIESERKRLLQLQQKADETQQKLNRNMQTSYQYQLKIQEGKKSIESLSDINKTLAEMIDRQNQLKRQNLELELQNQHLSEIKQKLLGEIKLKYDDQDQNL